MGDTMEQILVGSYTTGTESDGIYRLKVEQGMIRDIEVVMFAEDPSYLLPVPGGLYWVNESLGSKEGKVGFARKRLRRDEAAKEHHDCGSRLNWLRIGTILFLPGRRYRDCGHCGTLVAA